MAAEFTNMKSSQLCDVWQNTGAVHNEVLQVDD